MLSTKYLSPARLRLVNVHFYHRVVSFGISHCLISHHRSYATGQSASLKTVKTPQLPRLPVPDLNETVTKLLRSIRPFVNDAEYLDSKNACNELLMPSGVGEKLQRLLLKRAEDEENWLSEWWLRSAYLEYREPVVVHSSPGLVFPLQRFSSQQDQLNYASKLIYAALKFKEEIENGSLIHELSGKQPVDMSQYKKVLSSCRIPGETSDEIRTYDPSISSHITVAFRNHFYEVPVYDTNRNIVSPGEICTMLNHIIQSTNFPDKPFGILTTENRNSWAKAYNKLMNDQETRISIEKIQSSIFMLALDGNSPEMNVPNRKTLCALQMLHGNGPSTEAGNRWYDKTIQFVVGQDGNVGLTYEHSPAEGPPITAMMDYILTCIDSIPDQTNSLTKAHQVKKLKIVSSDAIDNYMEVACQNLDSLVHDLEMTCFTYADFGKDLIKTYKFSPDSYIQMALQLAFYRLHNIPAGHYESASTRKFIHGRTETIRSCSVESVDFAMKMLDETTSDSEKVEAMRRAIAGHKKYAVLASDGQGIDRHLLGLKLLAIQEGYNLPSIFLDQGYQKSVHMRLSTSQVPSKNDAFMCYGPLVPDGYGVCYNPRENSINFAISAMNSSPETYSGDFHDSLVESLGDMKNVLMRSE